MPNNADFTKVENLKEIKINPNGWINPIIIEYGNSNYGVTPSIFWRVKGTLHTFVIPSVRLEFLSSGNYASHFTEVLEGFREDFNEWKSSGFDTSWSQEYRNQYKKFIL